MSLSVITASTGDPVTLAVARDHVRGSTADNTLITNLVTAATLRAEVDANRYIMPQVVRYQMPHFPPSEHLELPRAARSTTDFAISYRKEGSTAYAAYSSTNVVVNYDAEPAVVSLKAAVDWPNDTLEVGDSVRVEFATGYASATAVPQTLKQAILLAVGHWYENRESVVVGTISSEVQQAYDALITTERVPFVP